MGLGIVLNRNRQVPAEDSPAFGAIAERFRRAGDLERAVALCQEGLQKFPGHLSARVTLGWSFLDLGRYDEARAELEQVLKRAPDNLAAIRGLAELHDRAEHDEMAAMHRDGSKWMTEAAAAGTSETALATPAPASEPPRAAAPAVASSESFVPHPRPAVAPMAVAAPKPAVAVSVPPIVVERASPVVDPVLDVAVDEAEIEAGIAALGVFAAKPQPAASAPPTPPAPPTFAAPTAAEKPAAKPQPAVSAFAAPTNPEPAAAAAEPSPWQPVEIESAAAHLLEATASSAWRAPATPVKPAAPVVPAAWQPEAEAAEETASFTAPAMDLGSTDLEAGAVDLQEFAEFALNDVADPVAPASPGIAASHSAAESATPVAARAVEAVPVIDLSAMAPVAADTPTLIQPRVPSLEELDPELPALVDDAWSEQQDVYVLPAAVEAERAIADEGPGVWPPVIPDDPVEAPIAAREPAPAAPAEAAPARRPNLGALNKFLRRVETRRSAVVAEYLAG